MAEDGGMIPFRYVRGIRVDPFALVTSYSKSPIADNAESWIGECYYHEKFGPSVSNRLLYLSKGMWTEWKLSKVISKKSSSSIFRNTANMPR